MAELEKDTGKLSRAALLCGYEESHNVADRYKVRMRMVGGSGRIQIMVHDYGNGRSMMEWETHHTLTEARKAVARLKRDYKDKDKA